MITISVLKVVGQYPQNLIRNNSFEDGTYLIYTPCIVPLSGNLHNDVNNIDWWKSGGNGNCGRWVGFEPLCDPALHTNLCPYNPLYRLKALAVGNMNLGQCGVGIPLSNKLDINKMYKFRILAAGYHNQHFAVSFSFDEEWWDGNKHRMAWAVDQALPIDAEPCNAYVLESVVQAQYDDLNHMVLQSVQGDASLPGHLLLDRIELYEYCSEYLVRQGRVYKFISELEEANYIIAGGKVNGVHLGDVDLLVGSVTKYKANTEVRLVEGFNVNRGADFTAKIGKCGSECSSSNINIPTDYVICDNNCITLNGGISRGMTYQWSSPNPAHMQYLRGAESSHPIFCPPTVTNYGNYVYTVTITNTCGESTTKTVHVHYDTNSDPNPDFQVLSSNLSQSPDNPSISLIAQPHTEYVTFEVLDCDDNVLRTDTYKGGIHFSPSATINWTMNEFMDPCGCYRIRVRSKNFCYEEIKQQVFEWRRNRTPSNMQLPTSAFCLNGKRWICVGASGVASINVQIFNRWGNTVMETGYPYTGHPFCFEVPDGDDLSAGTYYMIVTFIGCDGTEVVSNQTTIYLPYCGDGLVSNPDSSANNWNGDTYASDISYYNLETGLYDSLYTSVSPNPMTESATISYHIPKSGSVKITILNSNFETKATLTYEQQVQAGDYSVQMNTEPLLNGINYYMIELNNEKTARLIRRISVVK